MKFRSSKRALTTALTLTLGIATSAFLPSLQPILASDATVPSSTEISFPDTENYWGQPFIHSLAERGIVTGYPDNTYRPEQPVARDEFAAILRQAFSQAPERQISSGSVYTDVPAGYWAAPAIHDAYEMGFMKGYPGGEFRPTQSVTKAEVLVSLAQNLDLSAATADPTTAQSSTVITATPQQPTDGQRAMRPLMFPLAMTVLMAPLMTSTAQAEEVPEPVASPERTQPETANAPLLQRPVSLIVSDYYDDAAQIPDYAVDDIARLTEAGIVVNYPDPRVLNPNQPATRGEVAALIHQVLVQQGRIEPLSEAETATGYIVDR